MHEDLLQRTGLSLDRLRSFVAVADAGGIARAAPGQPVRQSQLSRQISELEAFFGHPLLRRAGRTVEPTELGRTLANVVRATVAGLEDVAREASDAPSVFRLGAGDSALHWWIIPGLGRIAARAPRVALRLVAMSRQGLLDGVASGQLDLALVRGDAPSSGLAARLVARVSYAIFVPRALRGRGALSELPLALQHSEPELNERLLRGAARDASSKASGRPLALRDALACETFPQVARAVASGQYAGMLPTSARAELPGCDILDAKGALPKSTPVHLVWQPRTVRARAHAEALIEAVVDESARWAPATAAAQRRARPA